MGFINPQHYKDLCHINMDFEVHYKCMRYAIKVYLK